MKLLILTILFSFIKETVIAQSVIEQYEQRKDSIGLGPGSGYVFPYNPKGYSLFLPAGSKKGMIISVGDDRAHVSDSAAGEFFSSTATNHGFVYLHISTGVPVDLFFSDSSPEYARAILEQLIKKHQLPEKNIFLLGVMTSGHRALRFAEYLINKKKAFAENISGIILCESALDWVRQWYEGQKQVRDHLTEVSYFEGTMVNYLFSKYFNCTPSQCHNKYIRFSAYSYFDTKMVRIRSYKHIPLLAITFADTDYWFSAPGKGVFDSNYPDMSGLINELKLSGNPDAELVVLTRENKSGYHTRQSNTWVLADKDELMKWILQKSK